MVIKINAVLKIDIRGMPAKLVTALKRIATFANPEFFKKQKLRFSTWNIPKYIFCGHFEGGRLELPKGTLEIVKEVFNQTGSTLSIQDNRNAGKYPVPESEHNPDTTLRLYKLIKTYRA